MHQESMTMTPPLLVLLAFLLIFVLRPAACSTPSTGFRLAMNHVDSTGSFTTRERLHRAAERSRRRAEHLMIRGRKMISVEAPVHAGSLEYIVDVAIGTPPLPISAIADTGSDLIWTQCLPCDHCVNQPTPFYNRSSSSSFQPLPCGDQIPCKYSTSYVDNSSTSGYLGRETFTFSYAGNTSSADLVFGCGTSNHGDFANSTGIVGLGRGNLSLISQLRPGKFSYCLTLLNESISSPLLLGSLADLTTGSGGGVIQSTPIIQSPPTHPQSSYYYLSLGGVSFGNVPLQIPNDTFQLKPDGSGGLVIDSGSSFTSLEPSAYGALKKAIVSAVSLPLAPNSTNDLLCFSLPSSASAPPDMPDVTFHFDGANMTVPYMVWDPSDGALCLTILPGQSGEMSVMGNFQQQNMHILFDVSSSVLSFVPAQCDQI